MSTDNPSKGDTRYHPGISEEFHKTFIVNVRPVRQGWDATVVDKDRFIVGTAYNHPSQEEAIAAALHDTAQRMVAQLAAE